jgi:hypothetical protein
LLQINEKIRFRLYILLPLSIALQAIPALAYDDKSDLSREYQIKAAFLYNFMQFVDWPEEKVSDTNDPIILGIIGKDPFGDAFKPIENKRIKGKKSLIKRFEGIEKLKKSDDKGQSTIEIIRQCHLLFICSSEKENLKEIINLVSGHNILTVGETPNMLKSGGIVNFLLDENKVRFEINLSASKRENIKIRSQLLRLAKKVIDNNNLANK